MSWTIGNKVGPSGPQRARIMIVGEAPGADEEKLGRPFVGKSGDLLRKYLMSVGIDAEECWLTNICKYRPPENDISKFFDDEGNPNSTVQAGIAELVVEIMQLRPNVIIAVGNYALWALTDKSHWSKGQASKPGSRGYKGITDWRGSIVESSLVPGQKVVATYHPAYILREGMKHQVAFKTDLLKALEQSSFPELRLPKPWINADPQGHDRLEVRDRLLGDMSKVLTFDIEYLKKANGQPNLLCVGMTTSRDEAHVIVTRTASDIQFVRSILESGIGLNAQNSMYDCGVLDWHYQFDTMGRVVFDTMLCQHASAIEQPKALDYLASIYTDQPQWKHMVDWKKISKGLQSIDTVWEYNGIDTWVEHAVMEEQIKYDLVDPNVKRTFLFEMSLLKPLWDMSRRGVRIDPDRMAQIKQDCQVQALDGIIGLTAIFGPREFNVFSRPQMQQILYKDLGLPVIKRTATGPSCDDKVLAELAIKATHPIAVDVIRFIRSIRKARSLESKFVEIDLGEDKRMRGLYNPARTNTGRLASAKFHPTDEGANQQNFPRDKRVRKCFIPDEGKEFGYADLEKAESRVVAYLANDPEMLAAHAPGVNAHKRLGARLFDKPESEIDDDEYYLSKKTRHAGNYMQGPRTFMTNVNQEADKTGVSIDYGQAKTFIEIYKKMHHMLRPWWDSVERQLYKDRTLYNLLGRKRVFLDHLSNSLPNAVAYVPQSTVGDVLNVGLLNLSGVECQYAQERGIVANIRDRYETLRECGFEVLLQIHDAVGFQYNEGTGHIVLPIVRDSMLIPLTEPVTREEFIIPVEVAVGKSWGEVKVWHETKLAA